MRSFPFMRIPLFFLLLFFFSGCASSLDYKMLNSYARLDDCQQALDYLEKASDSYGKNKKLLYLLDSAMINMRCGDYDESNRFFHSAEELAEKLWTKSISRELTSFIISDYTIPYDGEDFERAQINLFSAVNYARLGNYEDALVECRRLDSLLSMYNDKYEQKNVFKEDAFGRYLSGILYETEGNLSDAYIDYYKAFKTYEDYATYYGTPMPSSLVKGLLRVAEATDRFDEARLMVGNTNLWKWPGQKEVEELGKVVLINLNGQSPVKRSHKFTVATKRGPISIAFPIYKVSSPSCRKSQLIVKSEDQVHRTDAEIVEDINRIAVKNLDDRKGRVITKAIARAVAKQAAVNQLTKDENVKILFNIINTIAIERADTRSWQTLPGELWLAIQYLPPGKYKTYFNHCGAHQYIEDVEVKAGETKILLVDTM